MKSNYIKQIALVLLASAALIPACKPVYEFKPPAAREQPSPPAAREEGMALLSVTIDKSARTVFPDADIDIYRLVGERNGESSLLAEFSGESASVSLRTGTWNFTLNAYNDDDECVLEGTVPNKEIAEDTVNELAFSLSPFMTSGSGAIEITVSFPDYLGIDRITVNGDVAGADAAVTGGTYTYTESEAAAGYRLARFTLYRGAEKAAVVSEMVQVARGMVSRKTLYLSGNDLKPSLFTRPAADANDDGTVDDTDKTLAAQLDWLDAHAVPDGNYLIELTSAGEEITPRVLLYKDAGNVVKTGITVTIIGIGTGDTNQSVTPSAAGSVFTVGEGVTLSLENKITLSGRNDNTYPLVTVNAGGKLILASGAKITGNTNAGEHYYPKGGGVHVAEGGTFIMNGGEISGNTAASNISYQDSNGEVPARGGGVYAAGTFILNGGVITGNASTSNAGVVKGSKLPAARGGGVYADTGATFTMTDGAISLNTVSTSTSTSGPGGAGVSLGASAVFIMKGGTIAENTVAASVNNLSADAIIGGSGVFVDANADFTMEGGSISANKFDAKDSNRNHPYGGGVFIAPDGKFTLKGGEITKNNATRGGGVYAGEGGTFIMEGGALTENIAQYLYDSYDDHAATDAYGGGVYVGANAAFSMNGGAIAKNTVNPSYDTRSAYQTYMAYGGGVHVDESGTFTMNNGTITGNASLSHIDALNPARGGGVSVLRGSFTMYGGSIAGNTATARGGGVSVINGAFTLDGGAVTGNSVFGKNTEGGGVYVWGNVSFTMKKGEISGNSAGNNGGGVFITGEGNFEMSGGSISRNAALGTPAYPSSPYGGGVYIAANSSFTMTGGTISENRASVSLDSGASLAAAYGGGVYVGTGGTFSLIDGTISKNSAYSYIPSGYAQTRAYGGGVYAAENAVFTMSKGLIEENTASAALGYADAYGGGVYAAKSASFTLHDGEISGNRVTSSYNAYGGGVYMGESAPFTMIDGEIIRNSVISGNAKGGGVYMHFRGSFDKSGGTIGGAQGADANINKNALGAVLADSGHAVYIYHSIPLKILRKESAAETGDDLSYSYNDNNPTWSGAWDFTGPGISPVPLELKKWKDVDGVEENKEYWFSFTANGSVDHYVYITHNADVNIPSNTSDSNVDISLYDSSWNYISASYAPGITSMGRILRSLAGGETYYVRVTPSSPGNIRLALTAAATMPAPDTSTPLNTGVWTNGSIPARGIDQWFTFTASEAGTQRYLHAGSGTLGLLKIQVYSKSMGIVIDRAVELRAGTPVSFTVTRNTQYYVRVMADTTTAARDFSLMLTTTNTSPPVPVTPAQLSAGVWTDGSIPAGGAEQWFTFTATAATQYLHAEPGLTNSLNVQVYTSTMTAGIAGSVSAGRPVTLALTNGAKYYVQVKSSGISDNNFRIALNDSTTPPPLSWATPLDEDVWVNGNIINERRQQWFSFTCVFGGVRSRYIRAAFGTLTKMSVQIYDSTMKKIGTSTSLEVGKTVSYKLPNMGIDGTYYAQVNAPNYSGDNSKGSFRLLYDIERSDPYDPSNGYPTPTDPITPPPASPVALSAYAWTEGVIATVGGEQWFTLTPDIGSNLYVGFGTLDDLYIYAYDSNMQALNPPRVNPYRGNGSSSYYYFRSGQAYYVRVTPRYSTPSATGNFYLTFGQSAIYPQTEPSIVPPPAPTLPAPQSPIVLSEGVWADGYLPRAAGEQWLTFTASAAQQYIHARFGPMYRDIEELNVLVYDSAMNPVGNRVSLNETTTGTPVQLTSGAQYYARVTAVDPTDSYAFGNYQLAFNTSEAAPD